MVAEDLFQRSTSQIDPGGSSLWDYLGCLFDRCAPWPLVILAGMMFAAGSARRRFGSDRWVLLWCCALVPVVLFTIARTHHSWYIVPTYPFWAILAAGAIGDLLKRTGATQIGTTALGAAVAISLIVCEGRVISRMIVSSRMTGGQLFLQSLGEEYLPRGTPLTTAFTPDYSERFLLQAVDGFVLNDLEPSTGDGSRREPRAGWLLIRRKSNGELVLPAHWAPPRAYFGGTGYALAQIAVTGGK